MAEEYLIKKCVFGSTYDPIRDKACFELAKRCREEIDKLPPEQQKGIRDKVIDEIGFVNREDIIETVRVGKKEFPRVYSEPTLFDPNFDENQYVQKKKEDKKFGTCSLSLYGMEKQFLEQIEKGFFQTNQNAKALQDIENIILNRDSTIETEKKKEIIKPNVNPSRVIYEICNDVTNPKVRKNRYEACSEGNLNNQQSLVIKEKIEKGWKPKTEDDVKLLTGNIIWNGIDNEKRKEILDKANIIHLFDDYDSYSIYAQEKIREAIIDNYTIDQLKEMVRPKNGWRVKGRLDCWHNFLGIVEYPETIKDKWLEIQMGFEAGEINEKQATKLLKDLAKMEEMFSSKIKEGDASRGFEKPTTYQPIRMRLYGSQRYLNTLFNMDLVEYDLETATAGNSSVMNTIKQTLRPWEYKQLKDNILLFEKQIEKIKKSAKKND